MGLSLRRRIAVWCAVGAGTGLMAGVLTARTLLLADISAAASDNLNQEVAEFHAYVAEHDLPGNELLTQYLSHKVPDSDEAIVGMSGSQIITVNNPPHELTRATLATMTAGSGVVEDPHHGDIYFANVQVEAGDTPSRILFATLTSAAEERTHRVLATVTAAGLAGVVMAGVISWFIAGTFTRNIARLRQAIIDADATGTTVAGNSADVTLNDLGHVVDVALSRARTRSWERTRSWAYHD